MNSNYDTAPVRLEPHPADALDQRRWDLFDRVAASLHRPNVYRSVVITGGSRHFAAGADVKELTGLAAARLCRPRPRESALRGPLNCG